jgi:uncharacterized Zn-binding protein involved in type VI secretion
MPQIARSTNSMSVTPFTATVLSKTSSVRINSQAIMTHGDSVPSHSRTGPTQTHPSQTLVSSQSMFKVNGANVIIDGDAATCDPTHTVIAVSGNVNFN